MCTRFGHIRRGPSNGVFSSDASILVGRRPRVSDPGSSAGQLPRPRSIFAVSTTIICMGFPTTYLRDQQFLGPYLLRTRHGNLLALLVSGYIILLPYQFQIGKTTNIAPSDCLLLLAVIFGLGQLKWTNTMWSPWHFGIVLVFVFGSLVCALNYGLLASYEFVIKDAGLLVPFVSYFAITSITTDWTRLRRLLRIFVMTVAAENLLAIGAYFAAHVYGIK